MKNLKLMMSSCTSSSPHFLSIPTYAREIRIPSSATMPFTSLPFLPLSPTRNPNTPFLLRPPTLFRCFCSSTHHSLPPTHLPPLSHDKWEPFLKKKVVMRVGYVGTDYRGHSHSHPLSSLLSHLLSLLHFFFGLI